MRVESQNRPSINGVSCRVRSSDAPLIQRSATQVELLDDGEVVGYVSMLDSGDLHADAEKQAAKLVKKAGKQGPLKTPFEIKVGRAIEHARPSWALMREAGRPPLTAARVVSTKTRTYI